MPNGYDPGPSPVQSFQSWLKKINASPYVSSLPTFKEVLDPYNQPNAPLSPLAQLESTEYVKNLPSMRQALDPYRTYGDQFYQVGPNDTDLSGVANQTGVPLQQLVDRNNGAKTLPPIGSYIEVQSQQDAQVKKLISQGVPPSVAMQAVAEQFSQEAPRGTNRYTGRPILGPGTPSAPTQLLTPGSNAYREMSASVQQQLVSGQLPTSIPGNLQLINPTTGAPLSPQEFIASGYTFNEATGSWVLKPGATVPGGGGVGAPPQSGNNWMTNPALQMTTWGRGRNKFQTTMKWANNARRRQRRRDAGQPVEATPASGTGTASTVLEMRLGSG